MANSVPSRRQWVADDVREQQRAPGTHVMDGAKAGQLFLITNIPPEELARRYRWAAWLHLSFWLVTLTGLHFV